MIKALDAKTIRLAFAMLAAAATLALAVSPAGAHAGLEPEPLETTLEMNLELSLGLGTSVECRVTITKELAEEIDKEIGEFVAESDVAIRTGECNLGNMGILDGPTRVVGPVGPYVDTYRGFTGTLPLIDSVILRLNDIVLWIDDGLFRCLTNGAIDLDIVAAPGDLWNGGSIRATVPLTGGILCVSATGQLRGAGLYGPLVDVALI